MDEITVPGGLLRRLTAAAGKRREVVSLAAVATVAVVFSLAAWSRGAPASIAPPSVMPPVAGYPSTAPSSSASWPAPSPTVLSVFVHVAGAVRHPGLYEVPAGTRVQGAIEAAGGARPSADLDLLNLAELVQDGTKVDVPKHGEVAAVTSPGGSTPAPGPVNLNTADETALETIPGVGPVTATSILQYRSQIGSFSSVEQLLDVDGIGPATLESLRAYVTV